MYQPTWYYCGYLGNSGWAAVQTVVLPDTFGPPTPIVFLRGILPLCQPRPLCHCMVTSHQVCGAPSSPDTLVVFSVF